MNGGSWMAELLFRLAEEFGIPKTEMIGKAFEIVQNMERRDEGHADQRDHGDGA